MVVPQGLTRLSYPQAGTPALAAATDSISSEQGIVIEPVFVEDQPFLAVVNTNDDQPARVNGMAAPPVVFLRDRDLLQLSGTCTFQVAVFNQSHIGPPPPAAIGKDCPYCRVPIQESATVYRCACGAAIHVKSGTSMAEDDLECLQFISECPVCQRPIVKSAGYATPLEEATDD